MLAINSDSGHTSGCGVIFDFDSTLIDSSTHRNLAHIEIARILVNIAKKNGYKASIQELAQILSEMEIEMNAKMVYDRQLWFSEALKRSTGAQIEIPEGALQSMSLRYWEIVAKNSFLYPHVKEILSSLRKKCCLGMISDTDGLEGMKTRRLHESGLEKFFDAVIVSGEKGIELKPHKQPFVKMCELLHLLPAKCVYVGDNPMVDVPGPKSIGMKTIIIRNSNSFTDKVPVNADFYLDRNSFNQIDVLIDRLFEA